MLILLSVCLVLASFIIFAVKRNQEAFLLLGLCISLGLEICGVMIFIAKKGGISEDILLFLYFSRDILNRIRYLGITLNQLGFLIALGRTLFPLFFAEISLHYSMIEWVRKNRWIKYAAMVFPATNLILYYPQVYRMITEKRPGLQNLITEGSHGWLTAYLVVGGLLLLYEYKSITMKFCKRQFGQITACILAMAILYLLYYQQDPGQVYRFYSMDFIWPRGIGYLQINPGLVSYIGLVGIMLVCTVMGFYSLFKYTTGMFEEHKEDMVMQRKFNMAKVGASMFVHGIKNQLLASRVVHKRLRSLCEGEKADIEKIRENIDVLEELNSSMLERMDELYRCVKTNAIYMAPLEVQEIFHEAVERFHRKYPEEMVECIVPGAITVLADKAQLCEALSNLLINAQDAVNESADPHRGKIALKCYNERLYTVIEVEDNGKGMTREQVKKIFEPFYSSKNSNHNWGMGLYFAREVVKGHLGFMKVETKPQVGSRFFIMLPRYN
ncbi:MAG: HAMP domain-containing histidine kinase [Lachnospiraceae bacterium]|nr:HAMP domain-containing histidine kinase [Lachnospiraceae bacterium]